MLVLSRKVGERINIGDNVTIVVNKISGGRVSIAIEAPRDVSIIRGELQKIRDAFSEQSEGEANAPIAAPLQLNDTANFAPRNAR